MATTNLLNGRIINNNSPEVIEISSDDESIDNDDEDDYMLFCGNLNANVTKDILYELFLQGGPIEDILIPKNVYSKFYAFIKFAHKCSVMYCLKLFEGVKLFGEEIILNKRINKNQRINPSILTAPNATAAPSRISTVTAPSGIPPVMVPSRIPLPPPGITRITIPSTGIIRLGILPPPPPPQGIPSPIMTPSTSMLSFASQQYHESLSAFYSESRRISFLNQIQHNLQDSNAPSVDDAMNYHGGNFEALMHYYSML